MKSSCKPSEFIFLLLMIGASCELIDDAGPGEDAISKLEGQWKCDGIEASARLSGRTLILVAQNPARWFQDCLRKRQFFFRFQNHQPVL